MLGLGGLNHWVGEIKLWLPFSIETEEGYYARQNETLPFDVVQYKEIQEIDYTCSYTKFRLYNSWKTMIMQPVLGLLHAVGETFNMTGAFWIA